MEIKAFYPEDIITLARKVSEVWEFEESPEFTKVFCEYLVRCNYYTPEFSLKIVDEEGLQAIAFACMPGEENDSEIWLQEQLGKLSPEIKKYILRSSAYIKRTDAELLKMMGPQPHAAKFSLFFSRKAGYGTLVLEHLVEKLLQQDVKWLYLWTDSWCNWQYYPRHGFEQIGQGLLPEFSSGDEKYYYFLFRKQIG
ncbi:MAG: hypothetical protein K5856_03145 [Bacteroidaceae bacterium]|nr:hypothetical protein [Bacteroidaceae bacterium]